MIINENTKSIINIFKYTIIAVFFLFIIIMIWAFISYIFTSNTTNTRDVIKEHWNIQIPEPQETNVIYRFDYKKGADFEIWKYDKKSKLDKLNFFNRISNENQEKVKEYIEMYYNDLNSEEKKKFESNTDKEELYKLGNSYYFNKEEDRKIYILLINSFKENKIYYFYIRY